MRPWLVLGVALAVAGCGGEAAGDDPVVHVYASAQLRGETGGSNEVILAAQLALQEAGGRAGDFRVDLRVLDETGEGPDVPPGVLSNARKAAADDRAVAFLGNADSEATEAAIPITRGAGLLHVAPQSTNVGLVGRGGTFARVIPDDAVQAAAMVEYMRREGVRRAVVFSDQSLFGRDLCALVERRLHKAGIEDAETPAIAAQYDAPAGLGEAVAAEQVDAIAYCGGVPPAVVTAFHDAAPQVKVFLADVAFGTDLAEADLGRAAGRLHITGPATDAAQAKDFIARFRSRFGKDPDPQTLGGFESMKATLAAIERAGRRGDDRAAVRAAFFATVRDDSVLGPYQIGPDGSSSARRYGLYRVRDRRIVSAGSVTVDPAATSR